MAVRFDVWELSLCYVLHHRKNLWFKQQSNIYIYMYISRPPSHLSYLKLFPIYEMTSQQMGGRPPGSWFKIVITSYKYRKSNCGDNVLRPSYRHIGFLILFSSIFFYLNQGSGGDTRQTRTSNSLYQGVFWHNELLEKSCTWFWDVTLLVLKTVTNCCCVIMTQKNNNILFNKNIHCSSTQVMNYPGMNLNVEMYTPDHQNIQTK